MKYDVVIWGSEEEFELMQLGTRLRLLSLGFDRSPEVNRVFVINHPWSILSRIRYVSLFRAKREKTPLLADDKRIFFRSTSLIPWRIKKLRPLNEWIFRQKVKSFFKKHKPQNCLLWLGSYRMIQSSLICPDVAMTVFNPIDNMMFHPDVSDRKDFIFQQYIWGMKKADLFVAASKRQLSSYPYEGPSCILKQSVLDEFFEIPNPNPVVLPLVEGTRYRAGYIGIMQNRFDAILMANLAEKRKDFTFYLVGPVLDQEHFRLLRNISNIVFTGPIAYQSIPYYLAACDVLLMPHIINEFTNTMDPCKLFEYLTSGKPVISTPVNGTDQVKDLIYRAGTSEEFSKQITFALNEDPALTEKRKAQSREYRLSDQIGSFLRNVKSAVVIK